MKGTISLPASAGTQRLSIDWRREVRKAASKVSRKVLALIHNEYTPMALTAVAALMVWRGIVTGDAGLYKWSSVFGSLPLSWALWNEFKNAKKEVL